MHNASKPKVLIYRDQLLPPSETFILGQAQALSRYEPIYVGMRRVEGIALPAQSVVTLASSSDGILGKSSRIGRKAFGPRKKDIEALRELKPVLIHAHFAFDATNALALADALNLPLIATFHGCDVTVRDRVLCRSLTTLLHMKRRRRLSARASQFICVSDFIRRAAIAKGFPENKMIVHHIGTDTRLFTPDPSIVRQPIVLFVGRLVPKKGADFLLRAMALVQSRLKDAELVLIGDGPLRSELQKKANELRLQVKFLGLQPQPAVRQWMNRARILSVPSVTAPSGDSEGLPMVVVEAQSMGLPIVSFASAGIPEAVEHEKSGLLVPLRETTRLSATVSSDF
jgi:glycosyltransferase involved in cell wall biosynthesis